jgi:cell division protein FtsB
MEDIFMKRIIATLLTVLISTHCFAIQPGAAQAQIQNNRQAVQQHKQQMQQMKRNDEVLKQKKLQQQKKLQEYN